jgi:hypothetical protein
MPAIAIVASRSDTVVRHWRLVAVAMAAVYMTALITAGPSLARSHSAIDLTEYFNNAGQLPSRMLVMEYRVSFVYYLRPDVRARMHRDQIESFLGAELVTMQPFPKDAVLALPADLADERLARLPQLANAHRRRIGRYVLISPPP